MSELLKNRIDFVYIFDVKDGNPNGDPDAGNLPRIDPETGEGLVTDVCLKRKVRNYVLVAKGGEGTTYDIFIKEKAVLNTLINDARSEAEKDKKEKILKEEARKIMCEKYYDVRTFGAVMSTGEKKAGAGVVRGPVQLTFSRSVDPIVIAAHTITRVAVTTEEDAKDKDHTMGQKATVPYGLYVCHGFISANLAKNTGFSEEDLSLLWEALKNMFDNDRSAARGQMSARKLVLFKHSSELGNAPANELFDRVRIEKKNGCPRSFEDYSVTINEEDLPEGITIESLI